MDDIRGLKPFIAFAPNWTVVALVAIAFLAVGVGVYRWLGRTPVSAGEPLDDAPRGVVGPARSVRDALDRLRASGLIETGRVRDFHGRLSAIVRAYLGTRFDLPGRRLTSTELLAELARRPIEQPMFQQVADFLTLCDLAKFAEDRPTSADMSARLALAYTLVERLGDAPMADDDADDDGATERQELPDAVG